MAKSAQERLGRTDFVYLLYCIFKKNTNNYVCIYERKITVQAGGLNDGLKLHLSKSTQQRQHYRLEASAEDGQHISFKSITSIVLNYDGTINENNDHHLNTIMLEIDDSRLYYCIRNKHLIFFYVFQKN
jgi:hypothetical protein